MFDYFSKILSNIFQRPDQCENFNVYSKSKLSNAHSKIYKTWSIEIQ